MAQRVHKPPARPSEEASGRQLELARRQGEAFAQALETMTQEVAHGAEKVAGDYRVGYAIEKAEGLYHLQDGQLEWHEPKEENAHIEVVVRDAADGRFIPGLSVTVTLLDAQGREVGQHVQPFLWHPWLYHYGRNWQVPQSGSYTLRIQIEPPTFHRHDQVNGKRYEKPVEVEFDNVRIETGKK